MKRLGSREFLCKEGEKDGKLYVIHKGDFIILKNAGNKMHSQGVAGPHFVIGTESLLHDEAHSATIRAMEPAEVEEVSKEDLDKAVENLPKWFSPFLHFMADRIKKLESNKAKLDKIHAIPSLLFLCADYVKHKEDATIDLEPVVEDLRRINGLDYDSALDLFRAFCELGIAEIVSGGVNLRVHFYRKNIPSLLYRTLFTRMTARTLPNILLSANDQTILTAFISAAKTKGREEQGRTFVLAKDFEATYKVLFPGIKLTRRAFDNLVQCGFLKTEPEFSPKLDIKEIVQLYGDVESIKDLVELNRVYPLLDKRLLEALNQG